VTKPLAEKMATIPIGTTEKLSRLARRFRVSMSTIEDFVSEAEGFDLIVADGIPGVGYANRPRDEWVVEHYE
jgi:hypothetical protein